MKRVFLSVLVVGVLAFGCGKQEKSTDGNQKQDAAKMETNTQDKATAGTVNQEQLKGVLSSYFSLKDALVATDKGEAKSALAKLLKELGEGMDQIKSVAEEMRSKEDIEEIRTGFSQLSKGVYSMVKENEGTKEATVYKQFCPMAFNNEGAFWLSEQKEIRNPYFGDKMLKCGKVQEEL